MAPGYGDRIVRYNGTQREWWSYSKEGRWHPESGGRVMRKDDGTIGWWSYSNKEGDGTQ